MRYLSLKQAQSCENALHPRCRCRCGGLLHGAKRGGENVPSAKWFNSLPIDDPHFVDKREVIQLSFLEEESGDADRAS